MSDDVMFPLERPKVTDGVYWAEWLKKSIAHHREAFLGNFGVLWLADDLAAGRPPSRDVRFGSAQARDSVMLSAGDVATHRLWDRTKIVYDVDPDFQETLAEMNTDDVLPGDLLRQLPHPNPLFVWPAGYRTVAGGGAAAVVRAMYVAGRTRDGRMCSTHAEDAAEFQVTLVSDLLDGDGLVTTTDSVRMSLRLTPAATSIEEIVSALLKNFIWEPLADSRAGDMTLRRNYMRSLMRFAVAHLMYACSDKADVGEGEASRTIAKGRNRGKPTPGAAMMHRFGWQLGPAVRQARLRMEGDLAEGGEGSGGTVRPHMRRAHLHTFRHGPGRALSKVKWLAPIFVGANGEEYLVDGTIIPVG